VTLFTVPIAGVSPDPEVFSDLAGARAYVSQMFDPAATKWLGLTANQQAQTIRSATLFLDRQTWDGIATGLVGIDATTLAFPRTGLTRDGADVDSTTVPHELPEATCELAVLIGSDPTIINKIDQGTNISSVGAGGGVSVSFFNPTSAANGTATRLPLAVLRLIGRFLASPAGTGDVLGQSGTSISEASRCRQLNLWRPE
jgi:hypothetical protein